MATYTGYAAPALISFRPRPPGTPYVWNAGGWDIAWDYFWGGNSKNFDGWNINWDQNWSGLGAGVFLTRNAAIELDSIAVRGTYTNNRPINLRNFNFTGHVAPSYADIFYNRILIEPIFIDFGTIISDQTRTLMVFNGFFSNVTLDDIVQQAFDVGMELVGDPAPTSYFPLQERTYEIRVNIAGPPNIDASLVFDWQAGIDSIAVTITGSRIVMLPVTFRDRVRETLVWRTDVLNSYNGTEQRVRSRLSPRQQLSIRAYLDRLERNRVENLIYGWRKRIWALPMWIESRPAEAVTAGESVINADTRYGDFRVGRLAVLWESPRKFDVFQIQDLSANTITANRSINQDFPSPVLMPVRSARMLRDPTRNASGHDGVLDAQFEVTDNITLPTSASPVQYLGEDVYFEEPLVTSDDGLRDGYQHRIDLMDFQTGVVEIFAPWNHIRINREFELVLDGQQEIWEFREWLHRRGGRQRPFYMPTYENNLILLTPGTLTDAFEVKEDDYSTQSASRNHIVFFLKDGSHLFRTIIASEVTVDSTTSIRVSEVLNVNADDVDQISYVGLKRLASDRIELTWLPNNVATSNVPITELKP